MERRMWILEPCPVCQGGALDMPDCERCGGTGVVKVGGVAAAPEAAVEPAKWASVPCAYCRGSSKDPFGLSPMSSCGVCGGKGTVRVKEPYVPCRACRGTGVHPFKRLTCLACGGKGVQTIREPVETCPVCEGTGMEHQLYCRRCHGTGLVTVTERATAT